MTFASLARAALFAVTLLSAAPALLAQSNVWVVAKTGPADFTELQSAVDAASPGDLILVGGGVYENVVIEGKGVSVIGAQGTGVIDLTPTIGETQPAFTIRGVPAGQTCVVSTMQIFLGHAGPPAAVHVEDCAGAVWLQDLFVDAYGAEALRTDRSTSVVAVNSFFQTNAAAALPDGTPQSAPGARVLSGSALHGYGADFAGSHSTLAFGGAPVPDAPAKGGDGMILGDSVARLSGGFVAGSSGTSLAVDGCIQPGDGGHGVVLGDAGAFVITRGSAVSAGGSGHFDASCTAPATPGQTILGDASHALLGEELPRVLTLPARVSPGASLELRLSGEPGDLAFLMIADAPAHAAPAAGVTLHLDTGSLRILATLPMPTGERALALPVPALPAGLDGLLLPVQAAMIATDGGRHETGPRALAVR